MAPGAARQPPPGPRETIGSTLLINGPVDGSVRLAGNLLKVSTPVAADVLMAGATMVVGSGARVGRDVLAAGNNIDLQAPVTRNVKAAGSRLTVGSAVGGAVDANVTDLTFGSSAVIQGPVSYVSGHDANVAPGAKIQGSIDRTPPAVRAANPWEIAGIDTLALVRGFIGMAVLGLLLVLAFPRAATATTTTVQNNWPASLGLGFAVLVATPVLALVVFGIGLIVGDWWISLMVLGLYAMFSVIGYLTVAEWIGVEALRRTTVNAHPIWAMLLGLLILGLFTLIPVLGGLVALAVTVLGIGALVLSGWQAYHASTPTQVAPVLEPARIPLQAAA